MIKKGFFNNLKQIALVTALVTTIPLFSGNSIVPNAVASDAITKSSLAPLINKVLPSVVSIVVVGETTVKQDNPFKDIFPKDLFPKELLDGLLDDGSPVKRQFQSQGSGVIIDKNKGYIITNNHVIKSGKSILVTLADGRSYKAKVKGADPKTDIAVLEITDKFDKLTQIDIGNSDQAQIGDLVVALGNPFGIGLTATSGIVSALSRNAELNEFESYIQTDASINSGNSGGALVNADGELIGINSAILAPNGTSVGIGFAIPSNIAKSIAQQIIKKGKVERSVLGISGGNLTSEISKTLKYDVNRGAFVADVIENSAADKAGIKSGDVIVAINGVKLVNFSQLRATIYAMEPGTKVELEIVNKKERRKVTVVLQKANDDLGQQSNNAAEQIKGDSLLINGVTFKLNKGVLEISEIDNNSLFYASGLRKGDAIITVNDQKVKSISELNKIINDNKDFLALKIKRNGRESYIFIRP